MSMTENVQRTLIHSLEYLIDLNRDGVRPDEALERLRGVAAQHPESRVNLVWEEEAYSHSVHYDVLLRLGDLGTVSVSLCPERALPWPLRGVHRWREQELLRVNGTVMRVAQAVACLDSIWGVAPITRRLVDLCVVQEELAEAPVSLSDAELQLAVDEFRRARGLHGVEETFRWMEQHGMTHAQLESYVANQAKVAKLRDRIAAGRVEEYFERHHSDFDVVRVARLEGLGAEGARHTAEDIRGGRVSFQQAAERQFLAAADGGGRRCAAALAAVQRRQAAPELAARLFAAAPGEVLGPVRAGEGYAIIRVLSVVPAALGEVTRDAIRDILFEEWLEERRRAATVEWYWGTQAVQPATPAPPRPDLQLAEGRT
jgi:putative peptide maturation system protein